MKQQDKIKTLVFNNTELMAVQMLMIHGIKRIQESKLFASESEETQIKIEQEWQTLAMKFNLV